MGSYEEGSWWHSEEDLTLKWSPWRKCWMRFRSIMALI